MSKDASGNAGRPPTGEHRTTGPIAGLTDNAQIPRSRVISWALWDWGSASFNAVVTTFVFSTYLASSLFVDPAIVDAAAGDASDPALKLALAENATHLSTGLLIAGILVALLAPVMGQRSDGSGKRKFWLGINTLLVVIAMAAMFFVEGAPAFLVLGIVLISAGNVFFEFASVNYNAMLVQVSNRGNVGKVSGMGWGLGYVGGIVLLALLLLLFIQGFGTEGEAGILGVTTDDGLNIRLAILFSAVWFAVFAIPLMLKVPEIPRITRRNRMSFFSSYASLFRTIVRLAKNSPQVLVFLLASAVFRDGLAGVFTFGAIIAAQVFHFSSSEVLYFAVAANLVAGIGTFAGGWLDDRIGPKKIIMGSLIGLVLFGAAVLFVGDAQIGFWVCGLFLCLFVGPVQSASRSFLSRITPPGREGEIFGLYATSGRAVSFLAPGLFTMFVGLTGDTRFGILGIVLVLLAGLLLMLPVKAKQSTIA
ncbi:MFS transporter [Microbacterium sp. MPKO10]|uniref:MFS transporter n=1 Tax=Microbacterium sp. MPKO10 TaxID=2989818 RepID=UPI002235F56E|nr:MFS transporter [Microbacterium sp. MPKO10]MCW4459068.1 MFS transporter [Microbacterium sp. MPKO10]